MNTLDLKSLLRLSLEYKIKKRNQEIYSLESTLDDQSASDIKKLKEKNVSDEFILSDDQAFDTFYNSSFKKIKNVFISFGIDNMDWLKTETKSSYIFYEEDLGYIIRILDDYTTPLFALIRNTPRKTKNNKSNNFFIYSDYYLYAEEVRYFIEFVRYHVKDDSVFLGLFKNICERTSYPILQSYSKVYKVFEKFNNYLLSLLDDINYCAGSFDISYLNGSKKFDIMNKMVDMVGNGIKEWINYADEVCEDGEQVIDDMIDSIMKYDIPRNYELFYAHIMDEISVAFYDKLKKTGLDKKEFRKNTKYIKTEQNEIIEIINQRIELEKETEKEICAKYNLDYSDFLEFKKYASPFSEYDIDDSDSDDMDTDDIDTDDFDTDDFD